MPDAHFATHQALFHDMLTSKRFSTHRPRDGENQIRYVCLTDKNCQIVGSRKSKRLCLVLYGPQKNHPKEENTLIHARASFIDDYYAKRKLQGKDFSQENYMLFEKIKNFLTLCPEKPDKASIYKNSAIYTNPDKNWYFFCVKDNSNWAALDNTIRNFNKIPQNISKHMFDKKTL